MNLKFIGRALLLALPLAVLVSLGWILFRSPLGRPLDPTPLPPTILAPRGEMPAGAVGLEAWAQYRGVAYEPVGSGFLLRLDDGSVAGVTAAHIVSLGNPDRPLERIALAVPGEREPAGAFDRLRGIPGRPRTGADLTVDYLLLQVDHPVEPGLLLRPDPRGAPQPGERVSLYGGLGSTGDGPRILEGTVQTVDDDGVWVLMDRWFNPYGLSGAPLLSQHTGQVVGMAVAASPRRTWIYVGLHPIGSIVGLAEAATGGVRLGDYRRP